MHSASTSARNFDLHAKLSPLKIQVQGIYFYAYYKFLRHVTLSYVFIWCFAVICPGDQIKKNEIGGACITNGGEERRIQGFGGETRKKRETLGDPDVDGRKILRWIFRKWDVWVWTGSSWLRIGTGGGPL